MSEVITIWSARPQEEAFLFNPAFCGALAVEFTREFQRAKASGCPFVLPFCALPISLHPRTRSLLPGSTLTSMYTWLERHSDTLIGYKERATGLRPVLQEAVRFALDRSALAVDAAGDLIIGASRVAFTPKVEETLTHDARQCIEATRLLGRWFARAGTTSTVLSAWGLRP